MNNVSTYMGENVFVVMYSEYSICVGVFYNTLVARVHAGLFASSWILQEGKRM